MADQGAYEEPALEPVTIPLDQRHHADCLNLLARCRLVLDGIAAGRDTRQDALNMAQYVADAIGHSVSDTAPVEPMRHRCLDCGDYFEHNCGVPRNAARGARSLIPCDATPECDWCGECAWCQQAR